MNNFTVLFPFEFHIGVCLKCLNFVFNSSEQILKSFDKFDFFSILNLCTKIMPNHFFKFSFQMLAPIQSRIFEKCAKVLLLKNSIWIKVHVICILEWQATGFFLCILFSCYIFPFRLQCKMYYFVFILKILRTNKISTWYIASFTKLYKSNKYWILERKKMDSN